MTMTPGELVRTALLGDTPDRVPLHCRTRMAPSAAKRRWLRELDWALLVQKPGFAKRLRGLNVQAQRFERNGFEYEHQTIETPVGILSCTKAIIAEHDQFVDVERLFKTEDDYAPLMSMVKATTFEPSPDDFTPTADYPRDSAYYIAWLGYDPMHEIMTRIMGIEKFAYEWTDHRHKILDLFESMIEKHRQMYQIAADGPAEFVVYGANIQPKVVSPKMFEAYYLPCYLELGDLLHQKGKRLGAHLDDRIGALAPLMDAAPWDVMEGLAVRPDGDVSVAEARTRWPGRVLSCSFPSRLYFAAEAEIQAKTREMIDQAGSTKQFLLGLTEDFPPECEEKIFLAITRAARGNE